MIKTIKHLKLKRNIMMPVPIYINNNKTEPVKTIVLNKNEFKEDVITIQFKIVEKTEEVKKNGFLFDSFMWIAVIFATVLFVMLGVVFMATFVFPMTEEIIKYINKNVWN
jgi:hypothetical protein